MKNKHNYNINQLRKLAAIIFNKTKQGHPGMGISAIPLVYSIYLNMNISKNNPKWVNRDRFILSGGHGVMSLYTILYFCKIINKDDLFNFRQKNSITPGHPEYGITPNIDASTGPLGQGLGNAVGLAIAEQYLENKFNKFSSKIINHYTYVVVGDGDLQEGVSYEVMSLAGKLKLNKLIVLYDSNQQQLESSVYDVNIENIKNRVESMNWQYLNCDSNYENIQEMINIAKKSNKPTFIEVKTIIGEGFTKANSFEAHGMIVDDNEFKKFNEYWNIDNPNFEFDDEIFDFFDQNIIKKGEQNLKLWENQYLDLYNTNNDFKNEFDTIFNNNETLNINLENLSKNKASRISIGEILNLYEQKQHNLFLLSPDISKSTNVKLNKGKFNNNIDYPYLQLGIREFGMGCIQNGISLHSNIKAISSSFLVFSDYFKSSIRMSALMELNSIYIFTHDSIQIGSDGPTHQPIEQISTLRHIPNLNVYRPVDEIETLAAFDLALESKNTPTALVLSRQNLKSDLNTDYTKAKLGGYNVYSTKKNQTPDIIICSSGSELELSFKVKDELEKHYKINISIFSIPNLNKFLNSINIKKELESKKGILAIEASNDATWYKLSNYGDFLFHGVNKFGKSMDGLELYNEYGMNPEQIIKKIKEEKQWI